MSTLGRAGAAPYVRSSNTLARIHIVRALALTPVLIAAIINTGHQHLLALARLNSQGPTERLSLSSPGPVDIVATGLMDVLPVLLTAVITVGLWERIFAVTRGHRFDPGVMTIALLFTLLAHPATGLGQLVFALSFAMVFGRGIFGGEGKTFLNPALLAVAVLQISFPGVLTDHPLWTDIGGYAGTRVFAAAYFGEPTALAWAASDWWGAFLGNTQGMLGTTSVLAVLFGAAILLFAGIANWRLMLAHVLGVIAASIGLDLLLGGSASPPWYWHLVLGTLAFGIVFIASDPSSSSVTRAGCWVQGLLMGALVVVLRMANPSHNDSVVPVLLFGAMLAPLIDHVVLWFNVRARARRLG